VICFNENNPSVSFADFSPKGEIILLFLEAFH
jgi:hypothetical protein